MIHTEASPSSNPSTAAKEGRLRRIAILLKTLPDQTHRVLLGQLDQNEKQSVLRELNSLGEVDPIEQFRVLQSMRDLLQTETRREESVESEIQDEIQIGRARVSKKRSSSAYQSSDSSSSTVPFDDRSAARTPIELPSSGPTDSADQENNLSKGAHQPSVQMTPEALHQLISQFHQTQAAGALPSWNSSSPTPSEQRRPAENDLGHSRAAQSGLDLAGSDLSGSAFSRPVVSLEEARRRREREAERRAEQIDELLMRIDPAELCGALGSVSTKQAFLVLCGLPNENAEKLLAMLPRRQSRKVRADMRRMGQLQLSDIDAAKREVAAVIIRQSTKARPIAA